MARITPWGVTAIRTRKRQALRWPRCTARRNRRGSNGPRTAARRHLATCRTAEGDRLAADGPPGSWRDRSAEIGACAKDDRRRGTAGDRIGGAQPPLNLRRLTEKAFPNEFDTTRSACHRCRGSRAHALRRRAESTSVRSDSAQFTRLHRKGAGLHDGCLRHRLPDGRPAQPEYPRQAGCTQTEPGGIRPKHRDQHPSDCGARRL